MFDTKQKYVKLERNEFIFFPTTIPHDSFRNRNPISAGFCYFEADKVSCFGESVSLGIKSNVDDTISATSQIFGYEAAEAILTTIRNLSKK